MREIISNNINKRDLKIIIVLYGIEVLILKTTTTMVYKYLIQILYCCITHAHNRKVNSNIKKKTIKGHP